MEPRNILLKYLVDEYFGGDLDRASDTTGYSSNQLNDWINGNKQPQKQTVEYFMHKLFVPEFKVIVEYGEFDHTQDVRPQLRTLFKNHERGMGIYAFYDAFANLIYIGKATNLLEECYSAIRRDVPVKFPAGIKKTPEKRYEVVRYISAYDVGESNWVDYPKHVESLILRISKPVLNKQIGFLEKAFIPPSES
ncbi:hypothetical protein [Thalassolituus oleivorans]|uniref:hypothetical protein n=1 Tax=Thalassolituus oleivorans TaxID=187493 RepID=UPI001CE2AECA|nr:hypothetical protein [Thalassolituus oleivorans]MCA6128692.1 hypothetical protein [Thalassolituus oleivorans 4BN06-13]